MSRKSHITIYVWAWIISWGCYSLSNKSHITVFVWASIISWGCYSLSYKSHISLYEHESSVEDVTHVNWKSHNIYSLSISKNQQLRMLVLWTGNHIIYSLSMSMNHQSMMLLLWTTNHTIYGLYEHKSSVEDVTLVNYKSQYTVFLGAWIISWAWIINWAWIIS